MRLSGRQFQHLAQRFRSLHQGIGVLGGLTFFVGSIFFLYAGTVLKAGVWLFIVGSAGMLIGNLGSVILNYQIDKSENHKLLSPPERIEPIG
jgi:hypothetical protein